MKCSDNNVEFIYVFIIFRVFKNTKFKTRIDPKIFFKYTSDEFIIETINSRALYSRDFSTKLTERIKVRCACVSYLVNAFLFHAKCNFPENVEEYILGIIKEMPKFAPLSLMSCQNHFLLYTA